MPDFHLTLHQTGPQVFRNTDKPRYFIAFSTHMGCYVLLLLVIIFLRLRIKELRRASLPDPGQQS